ncbi:MAG: PIN domain-containing protein [Anaeromyxobacteraceae bacterium]
MTGAEPVFIDTNVLVAATVEAHPSHAVALALLAKLAGDDVAACVSPQVCREYLSVLTRGPVAGRQFTNEEALDALTRSLEGCAVLDETAAVLNELLMLVARRGVRGKQVHDANVVATMIANRVTRLATLDASDFSRYEDVITLEPVTS